MPHFNVLAPKIGYFILFLIFVKMNNEEEMRNLMEGGGRKGNGGKRREREKKSLTTNEQGGWLTAILDDHRQLVIDRGRSRVADH